MPEKKPPDKNLSGKQAVALRYDQKQDAAPRLVGKGKGRVAERIIALAEEHGIPIHQDSDLVAILSRLDLDEEIPPSTYLVVAEILAFVYQANQSYRP